MPLYTILSVWTQMLDGILKAISWTNLGYLLPSVCKINLKVHFCNQYVEKSHLPSHQFIFDNFCWRRVTICMIRGRWWWRRRKRDIRSFVGKSPPVLGTQYLSQGSTGGHSLLPLLCFFTCALCYIGGVWQCSTIYGNNVQQWTMIMS